MPRLGSNKVKSSSSIFLITKFLQTTYLADHIGFCGFTAFFFLISVHWLSVSVACVCISRVGCFLHLFSKVWKSSAELPCGRLPPGLTDLPMLASSGPAVLTLSLDIIMATINAPRLQNAHSLRRRPREIFTWIKLSTNIGLKLQEDIIQNIIEPNTRNRI